MVTRQKAYIALGITSVIWGTSWVASKIGIRWIPGLEIAAIRQFVAGTVLISYFLLRGEKLPNRQQFFYLLLTGVLLFTTANGMATMALKHIPSAMGSLISALYPLSVVVIERIFFRSARITPLTMTGLLLGFAGISLVFIENAFRGIQAGFATDVALSVVAMLSWSIGTIILTMSRQSINPYYAIGWQMWLSSIILGCSLIFSGTGVAIHKIPWQAWGSITYLIVLSNIITMLAFVYTMKHLPAAIAALYAYINPLVTLATGFLIIGEPITTKIIIGSCITLAGVYLVNRSMSAQKLATQQVADADAM